MLRASAIWSHIRNKEIKQIRSHNGKRLSPEAAEIQMLLEAKGFDKIKDINIRQNTADLI